MFIQVEQTRRTPAEFKKSRWNTLASVLYGVISNPIVFMTMFGIIANFAFQQKIPNVLDASLKVVGKAVFFPQFVNICECST